MDIALNETQTLLRDSIRDYLRKEVPFERVRGLERDGGFDRDLWAYLAASGYLSLPFAEDLGGDGGELTDLAVLLEELTRRAAVIPFMETMAAGITVARHGAADLAKEVVAGIAGGQWQLSPAIREDSKRDVAVTATVSGGRLTGEKKFVDYGQLVSHHLVAAREDGAVGLYLVDANAPEVTARPLRTIARLPQANISYQGAAARKVCGEEGYAFLQQLGRALAVIQCLACSQQSLDMTVEYVSMRVQFGRPIGSFQAVQHHVANMASATQALRFLGYEAVWKLDRGLATDKSIAIAKVWASRTATEVPMMAHQLHGGIGYTEEYDLHFFSRRGKERSVAWGSPDQCLSLIAETIEEQEAWV